MAKRLSRAEKEALNYFNKLGYKRRKPTYSNIVGKFIFPFRDIPVTIQHKKTKEIGEIDRFGLVYFPKRKKYITEYKNKYA